LETVVASSKEQNYNHIPKATSLLMLGLFSLYDNTTLVHKWKSPTLDMPSLGYESDIFRVLDFKIWYNLCWAQKI
jgi:hypothetical protein